MSVYTLGLTLLAVLISAVHAQTTTFSNTVVNLGSTLYNIEFIPTPDTTTGQIAQYDYVIAHYTTSNYRVHGINAGLTLQQVGQTVWALPTGVTLLNGEQLTYSFTYKLKSETTQHDTATWSYTASYVASEWGSLQNGIQYYADIVPSATQPSSYVFSWQQTASNAIVKYVIVHYSVAGMPQQNVYATPVDQSGNLWQVAVPNAWLDGQNHLVTFSYTVGNDQVPAVQYDSAVQTKTFNVNY